MENIAAYKEPKYAYRLPPCPVHDVEAIESWLSDMAREGLIFSKEGVFFGLVTFEKEEPQHIQYRLEAKQKEKGFLDDSLDPADTALELSAAFGWEYVARWRDFFVYRSVEPNPREMNTDPQVQALALKHLEKSLRGSAFTSLFWLVLHPLIGLRGCIVLSVTVLGPAFSLLILLMVILNLRDSLYLVKQVRSMRRRLNSGESLNHKKEWRFGVRRYRIHRCLHLLVDTVVIVGFIWLWGASATDSWDVPLAEYPADFPFATMEDFVPDSYVEPFDWHSVNTVHPWSNSIAPENYEFDQMGDICTEDGTKIWGSLDVEYNRMIHPWLARCAAKEYVRKARWRDVPRYGGEWQEISLPENLNVDYAVGWMDDALHSPAIVLQKGNVVIHVRYSQTASRETIPLERWISIMAESIQ